MAASWWLPILGLLMLFLGSSAFVTHSRLRRHVATLHASPSKGSLPVLSVAAVTAAALLASNFLGVTTNLLSLANVGEDSVLAELYDIDGLRRILSDAGDYSYSAPRDYEPDPNIVLDRARLRETPSMLRRPELAGLPDSAVVSRKRKLNNISVIRAPVLPGFEMKKTLGEPRQALAFLSGAMAPEGSGKSIRIIDAKEKVEKETGRVSYLFEYVVENPTKWREGRHTWSLVTVQGQQLYTLTVVIAESDAVEAKQLMEAVLDSFRLIAK